MANKKKKDLAKKQRNQIIMLVGILVAFGALMVFVTLPAMGINLFGGNSSSTSSRSANTITTSSNKTVSSNVTTTTTTKKTTTNVDENLLKKALEKSDTDERVEYYKSDAFEPYYFNFKDDAQVRDILVNSSNIIEFDDAIFMSYFLSEDGEKTAWIKTAAEPNKVYELKINSRVPNVPYPLQVIDITPMGVLLYRYPDEREKEQEETPRLYRLLARPYLEITELKATIK